MRWPFASATDDLDATTILALILVLLISLAPFVLIGFMVWALLRCLARKQRREPGVDYGLAPHAAGTRPMMPTMAPPQMQQPPMTTPHSYRVSPPHAQSGPPGPNAPGIAPPPYFQAQVPTKS